MITQGKFLARISSLAAFTLAVWGNPGLAGDYVYMAIPEGITAHSGAAVEEYWTPERLKNARDLPLPEADVGQLVQALMMEEAGPVDEEVAVGSEVQEPLVLEGQEPTVDIAPDWENQLYEPDEPNELEGDLALESQLEAFSLITPQDLGTEGAPFSSSRLVPLSADTVFPYRTVGKLFFTKPGEGDFVCSASVLRPRIVLTAGHCVHSGDLSGPNNGFFTNFRFVPAFRDGSAPFRTWTPTFIAVTGTWANGGAVVPNAADYAMLVMQDQSFLVSDGPFGIPRLVSRRIGDITGFLGFQTQSLIPNHAHLLGYPGNFDFGQKMHQVTAQSFRRISPNCVLYGSDMRGGSSGGPWVQNFGVAAIGQNGGLNPGRNRVIGVTSFGFVSTDPKVQGSSIPDGRFVDLLNLVCNQRTGNC